MLLKQRGFCVLPITNKGNACELLALALTNTVTLSLLTLCPGAELAVLDARVLSCKAFLFKPVSSALQIGLWNTPLLQKLYELSLKSAAAFASAERLSILVAQ